MLRGGEGGNRRACGDPPEGDARGRRPPARGPGRAAARAGAPGPRWVRPCVRSTVQVTCLCVTNLLYDFLLLLAVSASFQCLGVLCVQYHCELHRLKEMGRLVSRLLLWEPLETRVTKPGTGAGATLMEGYSHEHNTEGFCADQSRRTHLSVSYHLFFFLTVCSFMDFGVGKNDGRLHHSCCGQGPRDPPEPCCCPGPALWERGVSKAPAPGAQRRVALEGSGWVLQPEQSHAAPRALCSKQGG